jgi:ABC-type multidrug transport system ATPase subunit
LVAAVVAVKFQDDKHYSNIYYAKVGGVSTQELGALEINFMTMLDWRVHVTEEEYNDGFDRLCNDDELLVARENLKVGAHSHSGTLHELDNSSAHEPENHASFTLPRPQSLEGVKSRKKVIVRVGSSDEQSMLTDDILTLSQASRALVVGARCAGKTTLTKVLAKEEMPSGVVHMMVSGCCVSRVSEESLRTLENHGKKTPEQYMMWMFEKESGQEQQVKLGSIRDFLRNFGVEQTSAYKQIRQLSHAMKVRVCLAAAMWVRPHILLLDEPTKLLNPRDLQCLLRSIDAYKGGVLITTHPEDETMFDGFAEQKWVWREGQFRAHRKSAQPPTSSQGPVSQPLDASSIGVPTWSAKDAKVAIEQLEQAFKNNDMSNADMCKMADQLKGKLLAS